MMQRPLPNITEDMRPFWDGLKEHKLKLLRCKVCGAWYWPLALCSKHQNEPYGANMEWTEASGRGKVFVFDIHYRSFHPAFQAPYAWALIELEEGPILPTTVVGCDVKDIKIGMPVKIVFEDLTPEVTVPKCQPL